MQIPVLIESVVGNGYRARCGEPLSLTASGSTREEALANLRASVARELAKGAELVELNIGEQVHPLARFAGMWKEGDPEIEKWQAAVEEYRQQCDQDPNY